MSRAYRIMTVVRHRMHQWHHVWVYWGLFWACLTVLPQWAVAELRVVATFSILGDIVHNIGDKAITLHTLVGPQGDPHTFEPSPADSVALRQTHLLFEIGLEYETWLDRLYTASGSTATRVVVTTGLAPLRTARKSADDSKAVPAPLDPHVWFDVQHVLHIVTVIREALIHADPAQAATYHTQAAQYSAALQELDAWIMAQSQTLPAPRRLLVTSHDTFGYFAQRYGFTVAGTALPAFGTDGADPAAGELVALAQKIRALGVPAVFAETTLNPRLMQHLASAAGVTLAPPLYTDALGSPGSAGETYLTMMRYNVTTIIRALQP